MPMGEPLTDRQVIKSIRKLFRIPFLRRYSPPEGTEKTNEHPR